MFRELSSTVFGNLKENAAKEHPRMNEGYLLLGESRWFGVAEEENNLVTSTVLIDSEELITAISEDFANFISPSSSYLGQNLSKMVAASAVNVAVHSDSFTDSDASILNLYQWFFSSLNTPIRLGPVHPGNRSVIVTRIVGESSTMEMQKDGVPIKTKKSLSKSLTLVARNAR